MNREEDGACPALPFLGVAAYAINKHLTRRRAVALGV